MPLLLSLFLISPEIATAETDTPAYLPLIKFDRAETAGKWMFNAWGGDKKAKMNFEQEANGEYPGFLRLNYTKSSATLFNSSFFQDNQTQWQKMPITGFYLRYRVQKLEGRCQYEYQCGNDKNKYSFYHEMGLIRDGKWNLLKTNPGGWNKTKQPFDYKAVNAVTLIFHGSGTVDIAEFGIVVESRRKADVPTTAPQVTHALYRDNSGIRIDGRTDEEIWSSAGPATLVTANGQTVNSGNTTQAYMTADAKGMYFAARCFKTDMGKLKADYHSNSVTVYDDESVEFYVDPGRSTGKFRKITVNANGCFGGIHSLFEKSGISAASTKFKDRWETEVFLPWSFLGEKPEAPFVAGINVTRNCYDNGKPERTRLATSVWNAVKDFNLTVFSRMPPQKNTAGYNLETGRVDSGKYVITMTPPAEMTYRVSVWTPTFQHTQFRGKLKKEIPVIPLVFPVEQSGNFHFSILGHDRAGAITFIQEGNLTEQAFSSLKPLNPDSVALFPVPKIFERKPENFLLPETLKIYLLKPELAACRTELSAELESFYGIRLKDCNRAAEADIVLGLAKEPAIGELIKTMALENDFKKIEYDGFAVMVTKDKILIAANEPRGILYGVNAFLDMVKMTSGDTGPAQVCTVKVVDWPRIENRFLSHALHSFGPSRKYDIPFYEAMLKKFPMRFRYNGFLFELGDYYRWNTVKIGNALAWNEKEYGQLIDFINANYIPVMPAIQSLGHMDWWLLKYDAAAALREDGGRQVICTRHPDSYKVLFGFYDEALKMCRRNADYPPRYFYTSLDEVRWQTSSTPKEKRCPYCRGIAKNQIYLDHIKKIDAYLKTQGTRMLMFSDMLTEDHNGLNEFKCAEIRQDIPKDVIMCHWSALDYPYISQFSKLGFENWKILTAYKESRIGETLVKGYGFGVYTYHWWLSQTRCPENSAYGLMAQALSLNNYWNRLPDDNSEVWRKYAKVYGTHLMRNWSRKPLRHAAEKIFTVDLNPVVNTKIDGDDGWFKQGKNFDLSRMNFNVDKIAGIPIRFAQRNAKPACLVLNNSNRQASVMLGKNTAGLILLHAAHLDKKDRKTFRKRENYSDLLKGPVIVEYVVGYTDGTIAEFSINYGWNIGEWLIDPNAQVDVFGKYVADSRYIWEGKTAQAQSRNLDNDIAIYQYEWVNPHPEKTVASLKIESADKYVSYALLAVSGRETAK